MYILLNAKLLDDGVNGLPVVLIRHHARAAVIRRPRQHGRVRERRKQRRPVHAVRGL